MDSEDRISVNIRGRRQFSNHLRPIGIELFREDHWQRCLDTLAKLEPINCNQDSAVGSDVHKRIRWVDFCRWPSAFLGQRGEIEVKRHQ